MKRIRVALVDIQGDLTNGQLLETLRDALGEPAFGQWMAVQVRPDLPPIVKRPQGDQVKPLAERTLELMRDNPRIRPVDIAQELYGDTKRSAIAKVWGHIQGLTEAGKLRKVGYGQYEVVE
jgi:hypothetical protein